MPNKKEDSKNKTSLIRSSTAEYLTFIAATGEGGVEAIYTDENIWLSQKMMGTLYNVETHTVNYHLKKIFTDTELEENAVIRKFRITATDGKNYNTNYYNLSEIIAVGYKVNSERAVQFRKKLYKSYKNLPSKVLPWMTNTLKILMADLTILMNFWNESEKFELLKNVFIKK